MPNTRAVCRINEADRELSTHPMATGQACISSPQHGWFPALLELVRTLGTKERLPGVLDSTQALHAPHFGQVSPKFLDLGAPSCLMELSASLHTALRYSHERLCLTVKYYYCTPFGKCLETSRNDKVL